jgi:hypothetical protein
MVMISERKVEKIWIRDFGLPKTPVATAVLVVEACLQYSPAPLT